jgi:hypothetical protein
MDGCLYKCTRNCERKRVEDANQCVANTVTLASQSSQDGSTYAKTHLNKQQKKCIKVVECMIAILYSDVHKFIIKDMQEIFRRFFDINNVWKLLPEFVRNARETKQKWGVL